jgi:hypothetical protein
VDCLNKKFFKNFCCGGGVEGTAAGLSREFHIPAAAANDPERELLDAVPGLKLTFLPCLSTPAGLSDWQESL